MITKQWYEAQLQQIFCMLLENKINEQIAFELKISVRTVQNYKRRLEQRYGSILRQKTDNTLFLECNLFKNRMLTSYKALENQVTSTNNTSGTDKAKCAEIAANIAFDVLKLESEGIKAVKQGLVVIAAAKKNALKGKNNVQDNLRPSKNEDPHNNKNDIINDNQ